jgi:hypothetical protein
LRFTLLTTVIVRAKKMNQDNEDDRDDNWGSYASGGAYGFLYVFTNQSMPGLVKVGQTERHPAARVLELSNHSGVPTPFTVSFYIEVSDRFRAEQIIHGALAACRVSADREFFRATPDEVERLLYEVATEFISPSAARMPPKKENAARETHDNKATRPDDNGPVCPKCGDRAIRDAFDIYLKCTTCGAISPSGAVSPKRIDTF